MDMATEMTSYGEGSEGMDASLWGGLQNYIDLAMVYAKLPIGDFFRLRQVCNEWNRLASDRGFLEESFRDPIAKPYFVVNGREMKHRLLTYEASSQRWTWTRLPPTLCEVAGLLCNNGSDCDSIRVFNVHTRMFHALPRLSEDAYYYDHPLIGMTVDTSVSPFSFQVIFGDDNISTRIYDSKSDSWTQSKSTPHDFWVNEDNPRSDATCVHFNGFLYIRVLAIYDGDIDMFSYNLKTGMWYQNFSMPWLPDRSEFVSFNIGVWQDRLFLFGMNPEPSCSITAWERTCNPRPDEWAQFDRMPEDLCSWMLAGNDEDDFRDYEVIEMQTRFCGEYVLVYNCMGLEEVAERAVLYNLDRKTWEKVELPGTRRLVSSKAARAEKDVRMAVRVARLRKNPADSTGISGKAWDFPVE